MKKLFLLFLLLLTFNSYAQDGITANMTGRWQVNRKNYIGDMQFLGNGKIAFLSTEGMLFGYILYTVEIKDGIIKLKYTSDIDRKKNRQYQYSEMKFLNDSTMLYAHHKLPADADTNTKNVGIYRKLKQQKPNTELRLPDYHDFKDTWVHPFKGEIVGKKIIFIDGENAIFQKDSVDEHITYKVDFTKQPSPIDFYHPQTGKTDQALIEFLTDNSFRIEWYPNNNRGDHFRALGQNNWYMRERYYLLNHQFIKF